MDMTINQTTDLTNNSKAGIRRGYRDFQHEEGLMEKEGYPGLTEQKNEHESLIRTTLELQNNLVSESSDSVNYDTLAFMNNWLVTNLMELDVAFAKFLHGRH